VIFLVVGLVVAAAVAVGVALLVRQSIGGGALAGYVVPYAEPHPSGWAGPTGTTDPLDAGGVEFVGGGVWGWGVRASAPLVRLEVQRDQVRLGPSSAAWAFLIRSLVVPRSAVLSVAVVPRPFGVQAVRFSVLGGSFAFIGHVDAVMAAITSTWPPDEPVDVATDEPMKEASDEGHDDGSAEPGSAAS
jgi:hypothetical protein